MIDLRWIICSRKPGHFADERLKSMFSFVFGKTYGYYVFSEIENQRKILLETHTEIEVIDKGAGSRVFKGNKRSIQRIARYCLTEQEDAQILFRLGAWAGSNHILELGTSLGVTTAYLATTPCNLELISIDACSNTIKEAKKLLSELSVENVTLLNSDFSLAIENLIKENRKFDFIYFDGDHNGLRMRNYYEGVRLNLVGKRYVMVFDDISWSRDMNTFWKYIARNSDSCIISTGTTGYVIHGFDLPCGYFMLKLSKT
ncbi:MAG TPA: class I SAM-dependent methyltransferase [Bacteroidales bacterium]|nr:class I SAM-dependent methyltransferase [Bacteroidales bacterium]HQP04926.1 class I SAM-dependent methyltransferase [Bacteroidales bacterium]